MCLKKKKQILKLPWLRGKLKNIRMVHSVMHFNRECNIYSAPTMTPVF